MVDNVERLPEVAHHVKFGRSSQVPFDARLASGPG